MRKSVAAVAAVALLVGVPVSAATANDGPDTSGWGESEGAGVGGYVPDDTTGAGADTTTAAATVTPAATEAPGATVSAEPAEVEAAATPAEAPAAPATVGPKSGLPFLSGVFAHDGTNPKITDNGKVAEYEAVTGRPVDLWQIAPERTKGDDTLLSETESTLAEVPAGVAVDYAVPIEGAGMGAGMGAKLGEILAAKTDAPVYVRPGWEFNLSGSWDWTTDRIGNEAFIDGFRATVDGLRSTAPNVRIVWNPNTGQGGVDKAMEAWPGDAYVDVIGVDAYDWREEDPMNGPGQLNEWAAKARELGKRIALPEWGAHGEQGRGDNPAFIADVLDWFERNADILDYASYFSEDGGGYINNVPGRQMPQVGTALNEGFTRLATGTPAPAATEAAGDGSGWVDKTPTDPEADPTATANEAAPATSGAAPVSEERVAWTSSAGTESYYHLEVPAGARGFVVYLDGDGQSIVDGGTGGTLGDIAATAAEKGYGTLAIRTPGEDDTWWGEGERNGAYAIELIRETSKRVPGPVWLAGYSGGAQAITKFVVPAAPDLAAGALIFGGGGVPGDVPEAQPGVKLLWVTGSADDGSDSSDGYDALADAKDGEEAYRAAGWVTEHVILEGEGHGITGFFAEQIGAHVPDAGPVSTATPGAEASATAGGDPTTEAPEPEATTDGEAASETQDGGDVLGTADPGEQPDPSVTTIPAAPVETGEVRGPTDIPVPVPAPTLVPTDLTPEPDGSVWKRIIHILIGGGEEVQVSVHNR